MNKFSVVLTAALAIAACTQAPATQAPTANKGLVQVTGPVLDYVALTAAAKKYTLQNYRSDLFTPFEYRRLDHIDVFIKQHNTDDTPVKVGTLNWQNDGETVDDSDPNADIDNDPSIHHMFSAVKLGNLKADTKYDVSLQAYQTNPNYRDYGPYQLLNDIPQFLHANNFDSSDSTTTIDTAGATIHGGDANLRLDCNGFKLTLLDQAFSGQATGDLSVTNGTLVTNGSEILAGQNVDTCVWVSEGESAADRVCLKFTNIHDRSESFTYRTDCSGKIHVRCKDSGVYKVQLMPGCVDQGQLVLPDVNNADNSDVTYTANAGATIMAISNTHNVAVIESPTPEPSATPSDY